MKSLSEAVAKKGWMVRPISISHVAQNHSLTRPILLRELILKCGEYEEVYGKLHAAILSRHFALNKYFRTNVLCVDSILSTTYELEELLLKDYTTQTIERWKIDYRKDDNPLMNSGLLLTCLAVECHLGSSYALKILKKALFALSTLYKFTGDNFDGYILRGDPVTRDDRWEIGSDQKKYSQRFLIDTSNNYLYCAPSSDPRYIPYVPDGVPGHDDWFQWASSYRHNEVSQDELVGLIAGLSIVYQLVKEPSVQSLVKDQINKLADYLNSHGYILVRPCNGFSLRGSSGILPVLEYPFNRFFSRVTGKSFPVSAELSFEDAMRKAKIWKCLEGPTNWWSIVGAVAAPVLFPLVMGVGLSTLELTGTFFDPIRLARAKAIYDTKVCFDAEMRSEFAVAYLAKQISDKAGLFNLWMTGISLVKKDPPAVRFAPYVCLTALDDNDSVVKNSYLKWLKLRRAYNETHQVDGDFSNTGAKSCFASAIALLLGGGSKEEEMAFISLLHSQHTAIRDRYKDNLPLVLSDKERFEITESVNATPPDDNSNETYIPSALDYMAGLALAWLYARRRAKSGNPITTEGFPNVSTNLDPLLKVVIPKEIWPDHRMNNIEFRKQDIQNTQEIDETKDADPFADSSPEKSEIPAPKVPPPPNTTLPPQIDVMVKVRERDWDVNTGIILQYGDIFEFSEISGSIWPLPSPAVWNGPNGWENVDYDIKFPLHGGIDPVNAHPFCLLGKLNNYFFIGGNGRGKERFLYDLYIKDIKDIKRLPLYLRINDDRPGNGGGEFICRIKVWSTLPLLSTGWSGWESLGGIITSDPAVAVNDDSTIEVFVRGNNNQLYHIWQESPHGNWSTWDPLGGNLTSNIAVVKNAYRGLEAFVRWNDNQLYHIWQDRQHGNWSTWDPLGGIITSDPAVAVNDDSTIEVFVRGNNNQLYHIWQESPHGNWSTWDPLGGNLTSNIAVVKNAYRGLEAFARGTDNTLYHIWQDRQHGNWSTWDPLGGITMTSDPAVAVNDDSTIEVFVRGNNNQLYHIWQESPHGNWSTWDPLGGNLTSNIAVVKNAFHGLEAFARGTDNTLYHIWQGKQHGNWSSLTSLGGTVTSNPAIANSGGILEAFARGTDNALHHTWYPT